MAMLDMCIKEGMDVSCAHVNYHTRTESDMEEVLVRTYCKEHHIECFVKNDPFVYTGNFEAAARDCRYEFFRELTEKGGFAGVLTAHHEDDLLETYLMQKRKGIIPMCYGIAKESVVKGIRVFRPLLSYRKKDLTEYCESHDIPFSVDSTNLENIHTRNHIRNTELSQMSEEDRKRLMDEIEGENRHLLEVRQEADRMMIGKDIRLETYRNAEDEVRLTALRKMLYRGKPLSKSYLTEIDHVILKNGDFLIAYDCEEIFPCEGFLKVSEKKEDYLYTFAKITETENAYFCLSHMGKTTEALALHEDDFPIVIRNVRAGDVIKMRFGTKKINRFFIDRHISKRDRKSWPAVVNRFGDVILVPGLGCDKDHWSAEPDIYVIRKD